MWTAGRATGEGRPGEGAAGSDARSLQHAAELADAQQRAAAERGGRHVGRAEQA